MVMPLLLRAAVVLGESQQSTSTAISGLEVIWWHAETKCDGSSTILTGPRANRPSKGNLLVAVESVCCATPSIHACS
jgi:hypothetical protein